MTHSNTKDVDRRGFLRLAGAGAALLPLLGSAGCGSSAAAKTSASPSATAPADDPDELFQAGDFARAEAAYTALLRKNPGNAHAAAQLGYVALLSNRFKAAESYLAEAVRLAPGDSVSKQRLGDCYVRQDLFSRAAPLLPGPLGKQLAAVGGKPYEVVGAQVSRIPFIDVDPLPYVQGSVNGKASGSFLLDTGAPAVTLSTETATKAGLQATSSTLAMVNGRTVTTHLGVAPALRLGGLELRNVPVSWTDGAVLNLPNGRVLAGTIGTTLFYHFLTTIDYKGRALVLRPKTAALQRALRAQAAAAGLSPQPLWLAGDHLPCTMGKINAYGPRVACIDSGGMTGLNLSETTAQQAGITFDRAHPAKINGGTVTVYPITADQASIGTAIGRHVPGTVGAMAQEQLAGFGLIANFTHEFLKAFRVTFDYTAMNLYIGG